MNQPINFSSRQIAYADGGCARQVVSFEIALQASIVSELNLDANQALKRFGSPKGIVITTSLASVLVTVNSTNHQIQTSKGYTAAPLYACNGDRLYFYSTVAGSIVVVLTDFEISPVSF